MNYYQLVIALHLCFLVCGWYHTKIFFLLTAWVWSVLSHILEVKFNDYVLMEEFWLDVQHPVFKMRVQMICENITTSLRVCNGGVSPLCILIGRDSRQSHLQSAGCQPGEWADDGGLREVGQWCECETWHGSTRACCADSLRICLVSSVSFFPLIPVFFCQSSCWSGSVAPSLGCRTERGRRLWVKCRQNRRTSETTAVSTNHLRFEVTALF